MLYFFYELSTMNWGFDLKHKGSAKVFYHEGGISELTGTNFPKDMEEEFKLPEIKPGFSKKYDLPKGHSARNIIDWLQKDEGKAAIRKLGFIPVE
jgi:hypothetical protein